MTEVLLTCPHCGFYREIPQAGLPPSARSAACPECKRRFSLNEALGKPGDVIAGNTSEDWHYWGKLAGHRARREEQEAVGTGRAGTAALLVEGWRIYRAKALPLSLLYLYTLLLTLTPWVCYRLFSEGTAATAHWRSNLLPLLLVAGMSLLGLILGLGTLLRAAIDESPGIGDALRGGVRGLAGNVQLCFWSAFLLVGGALWLLLPALIFAVYAVLAFCVFACERERGMDALCISRHYVHGAFLATFGRLGLLAAILALGSLLIVPQIVVLPYVLICLSLVYRDLRQQNRHPRTRADGRFRRQVFWPVLATCLLAVAALGIVASREAGVGGGPVSSRLAALGGLTRGLIMDGWRLSGLSAPGCGLILAKRSFSPGEEFEVRLAPSNLALLNYYVCVAREGEECYERMRLDQETLRRRQVVLRAPSLKGDYRVKVFTDYDPDAPSASLEIKVL